MEYHRLGMKPLNEKPLGNEAAVLAEDVGVEGRNTPLDQDNKGVRGATKPSSPPRGCQEDHRRGETTQTIELSHGIR
jgi:hypothetical protein